MNVLKTGEYLIIGMDLEFDCGLTLNEGTRLEKANYHLQHEGFVTVIIDNDISWLSQECFQEFQ
ncbi:hypothetical protein [uncultured Metabacillus sp.]|uniref:hypothetical protein n=1 Tax=uncultured Metabacillus sp. TaxID=2860135 RepID=UPI002639DBCA|nr:hypothetical protein [uncultured Metabacillus sp.]